MKRILFSFLFVAAIFSLGSCSGLGTTTCTTGCTAGNANLTLTVLDTPPAGATFLSFNTPIVGITLTSSTGTIVNVFSPTTPVSFDLIRLQSDSALLGTFQVPADTYKTMTITLGTPATVWANGTGSTVNTCPNGSICSLNGGAPGSIAIDLGSLNLGSSANVGLGIDFNLNNIITFASNSFTFDFTAANAITIDSLPRTGQAAGTFDTIGDFTGVITTKNGNNLTITSATHGVLTGAVSSTTTYTALSAVNATCNNQPADATCLGTGKTVSVDATISPAGVISITEVDFLDDPSINELEGIIYPTTTAGLYGMVVSDVINATGDTNLNSVVSGSQIQFTLDVSATFAVDTRNLGAPASVGFNSASDLFPGQQVMIHVKTATAGTFLSVVTDRLVLRYTRTSATASVVGGNAFSIQNLASLFGTFVGTPQVQTFPGITVFDNDVTGDITGISNGDVVSFRALYLNPNLADPAFLAAKVRKQSSAAASVAAAKH